MPRYTPAEHVEWEDGIAWGDDDDDDDDGGGGADANAGAVLVGRVGRR